MAAFQRGLSMKDVLCRAALDRPPQLPWGCFHCPSGRCSLHPFLKEAVGIRSTTTDEWIHIRKHLTCQCPSVIYVITCTRCSLQGVGETHNPRTRLLVYLNAALGFPLPERSTKIQQHLALPGHTVHDVEITFVDSVPPHCLGKPGTYSAMRLRFEHKWIHLLKAKLNSRRRLSSFLPGPTPSTQRRRIDAV